LHNHQQAEASQLVATVASAAEGYPFVPPEWMPSVLVPTVGLIVPAIAMAWVSDCCGCWAGLMVGKWRSRLGLRGCTAGC